jgi:hypothetical protein
MQRHWYDDRGSRQRLTLLNGTKHIYDTLTKKWFMFQSQHRCTKCTFVDATSTHRCKRFLITGSATNLQRFGDSDRLNC